MVKDIRELEKDIPKFFKRLQPREWRREKALKMLLKADVIGMTTTGAAIRFDLLRSASTLDIQIVIVEEAAAVLESHIVVSVPNTCKCLIMLGECYLPKQREMKSLIEASMHDPGDHKQLKPVTHHQLEQYNFNMSLFERLIEDIKYPYTCLTTQYRMRPDMSTLLRGEPHFYKTLVNAKETKKRPRINCLAKSVFFLNHNERDNSLKKVKNNSPKKSKVNPQKKLKSSQQQGFGLSNTYEAGMLIMLAKYLVIVGCYSPSDIAIITPYAEQKKMLVQVRNKNSKLANMEIATIDSFQGKEKDIILVSLVRSNEKEQIGFLMSPNRVCVALSRAKSGLFIIGDMNCLISAEKGSLWSSVKQRLGKIKGIDHGFPLKCWKHLPHKEHLVSTIDEDWSFCPQCPKFKA